MKNRIEDYEDSFNVSYLGPEATFTHEAALRFFSIDKAAVFKPELSLIHI